MFAKLNGNILLSEPFRLRHCNSVYEKNQHHFVKKYINEYFYKVILFVIQVFVMPWPIFIRNGVEVFHQHYCKTSCKEAK